MQDDSLRINFFNSGIRADFLENEAELSGSEEDSGDEYEGGQDFMEEEEGDREQFDENDLRNQVSPSSHFHQCHLFGGFVLSYIHCFV